VARAAVEDVTPPPWPEAVASTTSLGSMESRTSAPRADGTALAAMRRVLPYSDGMVQLLVALEGAAFPLHVFVWQRGRGTVLFGGPLALEPEADAWIARFARVE
jgi:hypothetical protein